MSYWSLCWELQNLGGMEKPKSSLADRTDGRLEMTWALVLLKCSLLRGWKEHKTETVKVSVQGLPMWCERSSMAESASIWVLHGTQTCMEVQPCWQDVVLLGGATPTPSLCWAGRWLSQGGPLFLSTWAAGEKKVVWGGWERESACSGHPSLCTLDFQLPAVVKGHDQTAPLLFASRSCLWRSCGSVSVSSVRRGWVSREQCRMTRQGNQKRTIEKLPMWVWSFISCALVEKKVYLVKMLLIFFNF